LTDSPMPGKVPAAETLHEIQDTRRVLLTESVAGSSPPGR
jgi:hypothetical protein